MTWTVELLDSVRNVPLPLCIPKRYYTYYNDEKKFNVQLLIYTIWDDETTLKEGELVHCENTPPIGLVKKTSREIQDKKYFDNLGYKFKYVGEDVKTHVKWCEELTLFNESNEKIGSICIYPVITSAYNKDPEETTMFYWDEYVSVKQEDGTYETTHNFKPYAIYIKK